MRIDNKILEDLLPLTITPMNCVNLSLKMEIGINALTY